jgi:hypothetical protein
MMLSKVFAVIAAMLLVGAVAAGTLAPPDMSLGEALTSLDNLRITAVEAYVRAHISAWLWDYPVRAFMERPVWLLPAAAGLLFAGGSMTAASMQKAPTSSRRRRS